MKKQLLPLFLCATTALQTNDFLISALELAATLPQKAISGAHLTEEAKTRLLDEQELLRKRRIAQERYKRDEQPSVQALAQHRAELLKAGKEKTNRDAETKELIRQRRKAKELHDFSQLSAELPSEENLDPTEEEQNRYNEKIALKEIQQEIMKNLEDRKKEADRRTKDEAQRKAQEQKEAQREAALTGPTAYQHDPYAQKVVSSEENLLSLLPQEHTEAIDTEDFFSAAPPSSPVTPSTPESAFGQQTEEEVDLFNDLQQQQQQLNAVKGARKSFDKWATYAKTKGEERKAQEAAKRKDLENRSAKKIQTKYKKYQLNKRKKEQLEREEADRIAQAQSQSSSSLPSKPQPPSSAASKLSIPSSDNDLETEQPASAFAPKTSASTTTTANPLTEEEEEDDENLFSEPSAKGKAVQNAPEDILKDCQKIIDNFKNDFKTNDAYTKQVKKLCDMLFDITAVKWDWAYGFNFDYTRPQFTIKNELKGLPKTNEIIKQVANLAKNELMKKEPFIVNRTPTSEITGDDLNKFILESLSPKQESHEPIDVSTQSSSWVPSYN